MKFLPHRPPSNIATCLQEPKLSTVVRVLEQAFLPNEFNGLTSKCTILTKNVSIVQTGCVPRLCGGLSKAHQLFGDQLPMLLEELNEVLAA